MLSDALAVSFDNHNGHDYIDGQKDDLNTIIQENRIPFDLEYFNKITKGGLPNKALNVALGTGVGKSLFMCHMRTSTLMQGKNVLPLH